MYINSIKYKSRLKIQEQVDAKNTCLYTNSMKKKQKYSNIYYNTQILLFKHFYKKNTHTQIYTLSSTQTNRQIYTQRNQQNKMTDQYNQKHIYILKILQTDTKNHKHVHIHT